MTSHLVAVQLPPSSGWLAEVERIWHAGDAVLPLPPDAPPAVTAATVAELRPGGLVDRDGAGRVRRRALPDGAPVSPGTALVVATSGATGRRKGVELDHAALAASTRASVARLGARPGERWLLCLPLDHVAGIQVLLRARALQTEPVIHAGWDTAAVAAADADHVALVPVQLARLLDAGSDLARWRTVLVGGGPVQSELLARAHAAGAHVVVSYGLTETCGGCVYDGVALDGVEFAVRAEGRVALRGPVLMRGYRGRPDLTAAVLEGGWLQTADVGRVTPDGRLQVLGRCDDVVVSGGENVPSAVVASVLRGHAGVADAAVAARPDPTWGEVVVAVVVPAVPARPPTLDDLRDHVTARLGAAAAPRDMVVVTALPRTALGKLDRAALGALVPRA